jgi:hypothetical protein
METEIAALRALVYRCVSLQDRILGRQRRPGAAPVGELARLERALRDGGLSSVRVTTSTAAMEFASFDTYWSHVEDGSIRIGLMLGELPAATAAAIRDRLRDRMAAFTSGIGLVIPTDVLVGAGTK